MKNALRHCTCVRHHRCRSHHTAGDRMTSNLFASIARASRRLAAAAAAVLVPRPASCGHVHDREPRIRPNSQSRATLGIDLPRQSFAIASQILQAGTFVGHGRSFRCSSSNMRVFVPRTRVLVGKMACERMVQFAGRSPARARDQWPFDSNFAPSEVRFAWSTPRGRRRHFSCGSPEVRVDAAAAAAAARRRCVGC